MLAYMGAAYCGWKLFWFQLQSPKPPKPRSLPQFCGSMLGKGTAGIGAKHSGELYCIDGAEVNTGWLKDGVGDGSCTLLKLTSGQKTLEPLSLQLVAVGEGVDGRTLHESTGAG